MATSKIFPRTDKANSSTNCLQSNLYGMPVLSITNKQIDIMRGAFEKSPKTSSFSHNHGKNWKNVDNSVDKLWISCGQGCGQLAFSPPLWIAVDKSASYPQESATYPQNTPQHFSHNYAAKLPISTVSTAPTIDSLSNQKVFMFVEPKGMRL